MSTTVLLFSSSDDNDVDTWQQKKSSRERANVQKLLGKEVKQMPSILSDGDCWYANINNQLIECETYSAALELVREYTDE